MAPCPAPSVEVWCCPCINKQTTIMHYPYESTYLKHNVWLELITFWKRNNSFRRSIFNDEKAYVFAYNYVTKYMMKYRMCFCIRLLVHFFMVMLQKHTKLEIIQDLITKYMSPKKKMENFTRIQFCIFVSPNTLSIIDLVKLSQCFDKTKVRSLPIIRGARYVTDFDRWFSKA